ncbi:hypothetical protein C8T65DRAFT_730804 [Cerioporus squamosus]|nr:hypothetical protein C8T65DRAFT_730804 [Cerioporus squamosus]
MSSQVPPAFRRWSSGQMMPRSTADTSPRSTGMQSYNGDAVRLAEARGLDSTRDPRSDMARRTADSGPLAGRLKIGCSLDRRKCDVDCLIQPRSRPARMFVSQVRHIVRSRATYIGLSDIVKRIAPNAMHRMPAFDVPVDGIVSSSCIGLGRSRTFEDELGAGSALRNVETLPPPQTAHPTSLASMEVPEVSGGLEILVTHPV